MTYQSIIPKVAKSFSLNYVLAGSAQKGYRNESYRLVLKSGEDVNLIFHKNEPEVLKRIESAEMAAAVLDSGGLPVRVRRDKRTLRISDDKNEVFAAIYSYLPGKTIPWEGYTKDHIKLLGWVMSDMHGVWRRYDSSVSVRVIDELQALLMSMERYFNTADVSDAISAKLRLSLVDDVNWYKALFKRLGLIDHSDEHILHMDLVRGNILFDSTDNTTHSEKKNYSLTDKKSYIIENVELTGVIDFEKAANGHPVFDVARTLAFLLVDCDSKDRRSIIKYFLQSGYNKRGASSFKKSDMIAGMPAWQVLNALVGFFLLHDFYKFLKHTPYESLEENHHFLRTRDILIDYGMILYNKV